MNYAKDTSKFNKLKLLHGWGNAFFKNDFIQFFNPILLLL